jgi:hypothetical protein
VDIVLKMIRTYVVDDYLDVLDIKTSCTNTCGNHDASDSIFEILDGKFSVCLILPSVKNERFVTYFVEFLEEFICFELLVHKDQNASFVIPFT